MIRHRTRIIIAGMIGNLIESFDMALCGLLAAYFAKYLFGDFTKGIFIVFLTFFASYLARPIGAVVMGLLSDIYGRKTILAISILAMGISTALIGFVPQNSYIGITSVFILLILRIIQSFSCGAEYLNASAYLVENAEASHRGYLGSWAEFGNMSGKLLASCVALAVIYLNTKFPELEWAIWRVPFVLALLGSSIGLYIRLSIPESFDYILYYSQRPKPKLNNLCSLSFQYIKENKLQALYVFALSCLGVATTVQIFIYGPMQAHLYGHFSDQQIITSNIISLIVLLVIFPLFGMLSDKINREKIAFIAGLGFMLLSQPFLYYLSNGNFYQLLISQALIAIPAGAYYATVPVILVEMFPINLRCTVLSTLYSIAASLTAGLTPLLSLILVHKTGYATSPSILVFALVLSTFITMALRYSQNQQPPTVLA